jgi:hypothetical protein
VACAASVPGPKIVVNQPHSYSHGCQNSRFSRSLSSATEIISPLASSNAAMSDHFLVWAPDYDDIAASAASAAHRLSRSCSRLLPASAEAASNAVRASS